MAERSDDGTEAGDVILEVVEDLAGQRVGDTNEDLGDGDETDHPQDRDRQLEPDAAQHPADIAGERALDDPGEDEQQEKAGADAGGGGIGAVAGDEPVGLDVGVGRVDEEVEDANHDPDNGRSEEHTSEIQSLMRISYAGLSL